MSKRFAILYSDGSFNVDSDSDNMLRSKKRFDWDGCDPDCQLVQVDIKVVKMYGPRAVPLPIQHCVSCPTCGTEVSLDGE